MSSAAKMWAAAACGAGGAVGVGRCGVVGLGCGVSGLARLCERLRGGLAVVPCSEAGVFTVDGE